MRNHAGKKRFFIPVFILLALFAVTFTVYWLWNNVLVAVVAVKPVTYWQAMGLLILSRLLLGGFKVGGPPSRPPMGGRGDHWREKWRSMSDEERAAIKNKWRRWGKGTPE
ncbi:hypothetical protein [Spirosoma spitsbergense]|uniref:hypothetical protein n=1 Tax=Spirosoma spitsbergense TaxID=431554 RepID=UPI00036A85F2|nr:hypothetical protein [Spirosoma spitsbergense]